MQIEHLHRSIAVSIWLDFPVRKFFKHAFLLLKVITFIFAEEKVSPLLAGSVVRIF